MSFQAELIVLHSKRGIWGKPFDFARPRDEKENQIPEKVLTCFSCETNHLLYYGHKVEASKPQTKEGGSNRE